MRGWLGATIWEVWRRIMRIEKRQGNAVKEGGNGIMEIEGVMCSSVGNSSYALMNK